MFTTTIKGRRYSCKPYAFNECVAIQLELGVIMGGVAGPVVEFAAALYTVDDEGNRTLDPSKTDDASGETLGRGLAQLPAGIIAAGGPQFVRRVLAGTSVEVPALSGKPEDPDQLALLSDPNHDADGDWFDRIYTGGNSAELYLALAWVITANFSPFGHSGSWTWSSLFSELTEQMPALSKLSIATGQQKSAGQPDSEKPTV